METYRESEDSLPFTKANQLCHDLDNYNPKIRNNSALPGHPWLDLNDNVQMIRFLKQEFCAEDLESVAPHLWIMSTQSSSNVNPLHRQRVKGREIIVTEDPRLHLVWLNDRIFLKPIPTYLLSCVFWENFLGLKSSQQDKRQDEIRRAALGYLRTYRHLIRHESDFRIAQHASLCLIPLDVQWSEFCRFMSDLERIRDCDVSPRYCYGEVRLSRLNFYAPLLLYRPHYFQMYGQYGAYFARLYGPILFVFALISTLLNSMQVALTAEQLSSLHWVALWSVSRWFSVLCLVWTALILVFFASVWTWKVLDEWIFAFKTRSVKRREQFQQSKC